MLERGLPAADDIMKHWNGVAAARDVPGQFRAAPACAKKSMHTQMGFQDNGNDDSVREPRREHTVRLLSRRLVPVCAATNDRPIDRRKTPLANQ